eukprot:m.127968 g.127968  ORF g.127968 m.127968 type:complete len:202 (-) comp52282_c0_seq4:1037-1642(-)
MGATSSSSLSPVEIYKELFPTSKKAVRDCRELLTGALEAFLPPTAFLNKDRLLDYKQLATASVPVALCLLRNLPDETRATLLLLVFGRAKDPDWSKCLSAEIIASIQLSTQLEIISFLGTISARSQQANLKLIQQHILAKTTDYRSRPSSKLSYDFDEQYLTQLSTRILETAKPETLCSFAAEFRVPLETHLSSLMGRLVN